LTGHHKSQQLLTPSPFILFIPGSRLQVRAPPTELLARLAARDGHLAGGEHPALVPGVDEALQVGVVLVPAQAVGPVGLEPDAARGRRRRLPSERARARAQLHHVARRQSREVARRPAGEDAGDQHRDKEEHARPHRPDDPADSHWTASGLLGGHEGRQRLL